MDVVEDFELRPTFLVERDKEFQVWREQKMSRALPGFSGGKLPGRSKVEEEILAGVPEEAVAVGGGVTRNAVFSSPKHNDENDLFSKSGLGVGQKDGLGGAALGLKQKLDCSQAEDDFGEGDVMDWNGDDETMGRCQQGG